MICKKEEKILEIKRWRVKAIRESIRAIDKEAEDKIKLVRLGKYEDK